MTLRAVDAGAVLTGVARKAKLSDIVGDSSLVGSLDGCKVVLLGASWHGILGIDSTLGRNNVPSLAKSGDGDVFLPPSPSGLDLSD
jgi:hypothetical protein